MQVKEKMLYAATKATVRKAFDSSAIVEDIAATSKVGGKGKLKGGPACLLACVQDGGSKCWSST